MKLYQMEDYQALSRRAASLIAAQVILKPDSVLGLATGSTPIGTYEALVKRCQDGDVDFSQAVSVNLDEYKGLAQENDQSYDYFMRRHLFSHVNFKASYLPDGTSRNGEEECRRYEALIKSLGWPDLQLLGLGHNGHIGFNEPADSFPLKTHCVQLQQSTIEANKRFFASEDLVPRQAYTMGIGTIMRAKKVLVLVSGRDKAQIVKKAFFGPVTPQVPASILQLHSDVVLIGDKEAFSAL